MKKVKVGVIYGGLSTEHEISINSGMSIINNLNKDKYDIYKIYIDKKGNFYGNGEKLDNIINYLEKLDVIFPALHGKYGEDGTIQGLLEAIEVPYVGCKVMASSIGMDKVYSKILFEKAGLNISKYIYLKKDHDKYLLVDNFNEKEITDKELTSLVEDYLTFPVFVKPSRSGSSIGVNKVRNKEQLIKYINYAFRFDNKVLIEEYIKGRELECAVIGNNDILASPIGEILSSEEFYSYEAKYVNDSKTIIPNDISNDISDEIKKSAIKAFKAIDGKGLSRVDFFLQNKTNKIYINEINTMPGFTEISMYPKLIMKLGFTYSEILDKLVELALENIN